MREREAPAGFFEPRFQLPAFLQRRGFGGRQFDTEAVRAYTVAPVPRPPVRAADPVVERPAESDRLLAVLARRERNNAMLIGPSGCGKSALVRGLGQTLAANLGPASLDAAEVVELDLGVLRTWADRVVRRSRSPVVTVENLDLALRIDDQSGGRFVTALASLAEARAPLICTASAEAYDRLGQGYPTLANRFEPVEVPEASAEFTASVLEALRPGLEEFHGVAIDESALAAAVELAPRVRGGRVLPGGAVDLLDTAAARLAVVRETEGDRPVLDASRLRGAA
ncbi:hypothetical protein [Actinospica acidithermotolerans]|uniref:hypothetical protein n=1 Tax=Actinospica acidithermotolerans TaxID=2828514 RepID=UPI003FD8CA83